MIKVLFGTRLAMFAVSYGNEVKQFMVASGMRNQLVMHLQSF